MPHDYEAKDWVLGPKFVEKKEKTVTKKKTKSNEPEPPGHDFQWALKAMSEGHRVRRSSWPKTGYCAWSMGDEIVEITAGGSKIPRLTRRALEATDWVYDIEPKKDPVIRLPPSEITDCRDCFAFRASPSHNLACAHARLYNNATERQVYVVPKRDASGSYKPLDDCPLKKKGQQ